MRAVIGRLVGGSSFSNLLTHAYIVLTADAVRHHAPGLDILYIGEVYSGTSGWNLSVEFANEDQLPKGPRVFPRKAPIPNQLRRRS